MRRSARAALATAGGVLLLCGHALSDDAPRLPRKGSAPGFEVPHATQPYTPRYGNGAGPVRETRERWERREREERLAREERQTRQEREERRELDDQRARLERLERLERLAREERKEVHCLKLAKTARLAQEDAKNKVVVGYLAGGLVGALLASSQNDDAYRDPKVVWSEVYDTCMSKRQRKGDRKGEDKDDDDDD
jgi:hypothetical protein